MKKFLAVVLAFLFLAITVQPAKAADVSFSFELDGNGAPIAGALITLSSPAETFVQKLGADGKSDFLLPAGNYTFSISTREMTEPFDVTAWGRTITAPGALKLTLPKSRLTTVRMVLPDGSVLPGPWSWWNDPGSQLTTSDGARWSAPFARAISATSAGTIFRVYLPVGSVGPPNGGIDIDGDAYNEPSFMQSTVNGGSKNFQLPTKTLLSGGDIVVSDAAYMVFDQTEIRGSTNSNFTVTGRVKTYGKAAAGTNAILSWTTLPFFNDKNSASQTTRRWIGNSAIRSDGTFSLNLVLRNTMPFFTAWANGSTYDFPSSTIPVTQTVAKTSYKTCVSLNLDFQGGVNGSTFKNKGIAPKFKSTPNDKLYKAVKKLDVDNDGIACEK